MTKLKRRTMLLVNTFIGTLLSMLGVSAQTNDRVECMYGIRDPQPVKQDHVIRVKYGVPPITTEDKLQLDELTQTVYNNATVDFTMKEGLRFARNGQWRSSKIAAKPDKSTNMAMFATQYNLNKEVWDSVFNWLESHDLEKMPAGKYYVCDTVLIKIQDAYTRDESSIEGHRSYIDLQWTIRGTEVYHLFESNQVEVKTPYNQKKDVLYFTEKEGEQPKVLRSRKNRFFLFFPQDPHRALLQRKKSEPVRKVVVKIPYVIH